MGRNNTICVHPGGTARVVEKWGVPPLTQKKVERERRPSPLGLTAHAPRAGPVPYSYPCPTAGACWPQPPSRCFASILLFHLPLFHLPLHQENRNCLSNFNQSLKCLIPRSSLFLS